MRRWAATMAAAGLAGCVPAGAPERPVETIRFETSGCYGSCPAYVVTVSSNGRGWFDGRAFTAQPGLHIFGVSPAQFAEFRRRLAPWRPWRLRSFTPGHDCRPSATDSPVVDVTWSGISDARLLFAYGCDPARNGRLAAALRAAPEALPLSRLVGA